MANPIKILTTLGILLIYSVLVFSINNYAPKIFTENNFTLNSNYISNRTLHLSKQLNDIEIICVSNKPTRWRWMRDDDDISKYIIIRKERRQLHNGSKTYFFSNLTIKLNSIGKPVYRNFSCSLESNITREELINQHVACVEINFGDNDKGRHLIHISDGIPLSQCLVDVRNVSSECTNASELTVDVKHLKAECRNGTDISTVTCNDLDTCDSYEIDHQALRLLCRGNITTSIFKPSEEMIHFTNQLFPIIIRCVTRDFFEWSSYTVLYPGAGQNNLENSTYLTTKTKARNYAKAIRLYALAPGLKYQGLSSINPSITRYKFADGEEVTFVCVAVKYLFMEGFQWKINVETLSEKELNFTGADMSKNGYFVMPLTIPLNSTKYGSNVTITCQGPVWNSEDFDEAKIQASISPAAPPLLNLTCLEKGETLNCTCWHSGWPQPNITWSDTLNRSAWNSGMSDIITNSSDRCWKASKSFNNIKLSYPNTFVITCSAKNFLKTVDSSVTIHASSKFLVIVISVSVLVSIFIILLIVGFIYWRYRKKLVLYAERQNYLTSEEIKEFHDGASSLFAATEALTIAYDSKEYEIPKDELKFDGTILGSGQFGLVLKGKLGTRTVAVKTIQPTAALMYLKSLLTELKVLQFIGPHSNIVNLIGANTENIHKREVFMVLDYCANGSLVSFLRKCRERYVDFFNGSISEAREYPIYQNSQDVILTTNNLIIFATEVASALAHLASKNVIHGDLAARNVLVTEDLHAKVCDFGLSKQLLHYTVYVQKVECPLPLRWMAVESLQDMEFSLASDKWSYGVVLWEIFSLGELPYPGEQWSFASYQNLKDGYRMAKPKYANDSIYKLMLECWDDQPQNRPSFQDVISQLKMEEEMLT